MKPNFVLELHSFSDVITNSSTDIFACVDEKSIDVITDILSNMFFASKTEEELKENCKYENIDFKETINKKEFFTKHIATVELKTIKEYYNKMHDWLKYEWERRKDPLTLENFIKSVYSFKELKPESKIIVICGVHDNSIPYWLDTFICDQFNAYRIHMG